MRSGDYLQIAPPWGLNPSWQEANFSVATMAQRYSTGLGPTTKMANAIRGRLDAIFDILEDLCLETCPRCPDPCCLKASPWFDFRDLVFLHLNSLTIPRGQPIKSMDSTCRYSSTNGCTLDRISRPWICTWYLCPVQAANLNTRRSHQKKALLTSINEIKAIRKEMEDKFIRVITRSSLVADF
jgi:hypothetical protein